MFKKPLFLSRRRSQKSIVIEKTYVMYHIHFTVFNTDLGVWHITTKQHIYKQIKNKGNLSNLQE